MGPRGRAGEPESAVIGGRTDRTTLRRKPERGAYDRETIYAILDEAPFCHLGFVVDASPIVLPTIHARVGDTLVFHGSRSNRMFREAEGREVCVTVTLLDGLVLARSAMHHSMNYRSAVVFGHPRMVVDDARKLDCLEAVVDHVVPGRFRQARPPSARELSLTTVLAMEIEEATAKIRTGPPLDDEEDLDLPVWAGVFPFSPGWGAPVPDPRSAGRALTTPPAAPTSAPGGRRDS